MTEIKALRHVALAAVAISNKNTGDTRKQLEKWLDNLAETYGLTRWGLTPKLMNLILEERET